MESQIMHENDFDTLNEGQDEKQAKSFNDSGLGGSLDGKSQLDQAEASKGCQAICNLHSLNCEDFGKDTQRPSNFKESKTFNDSGLGRSTDSINSIDYEHLENASNCVLNWEVDERISEKNKPISNEANTEREVKDNVEMAGDKAENIELNYADLYENSSNNTSSSLDRKIGTVCDFEQSEQVSDIWIKSEHDTMVENEKSQVEFDFLFENYDNVGDYKEPQYVSEVWIKREHDDEEEKSQVEFDLLFENYRTEQRRAQVLIDVVDDDHRRIELSDKDYEKKRQQDLQKIKSSQTEMPEREIDACKLRRSSSLNSNATESEYDPSIERIINVNKGLVFCDNDDREETQNGDSQSILECTSTGAQDQEKYKEVLGRLFRDSYADTDTESKSCVDQEECVNRNPDNRVAVSKWPVSVCYPLGDISDLKDYDITNIKRKQSQTCPNKQRKQALKTLLDVNFYFQHHRKPSFLQVIVYPCLRSSNPGYIVRLSDVRNGIINISRQYGRTLTQHDEEGAIHGQNGRIVRYQEPLVIRTDESNMAFPIYMDLRYDESCLCVCPQCLHLLNRYRVDRGDSEMLTGYASNGRVTGQSEEALLFRIIGSDMALYVETDNRFDPSCLRANTEDLHLLQDCRNYQLHDRGYSHDRGADTNESSGEQIEIQHEEENLVPNDDRQQEQIVLWADGLELPFVVEVERYDYSSCLRVSPESLRVLTDQHESNETISVNKNGHIENQPTAYSSTPIGPQLQNPQALSLQGKRCCFVYPSTYCARSPFVHGYSVAVDDSPLCLECRVDDTNIGRRLHLTEESLHILSLYTGSDVFSSDGEQPICDLDGFHSDQTAVKTVQETNQSAGGYPSSDIRQLSSIHLSSLNETHFSVNFEALAVASLSTQNQNPITVHPSQQAFEAIQPVSDSGYTSSQHTVFSTRQAPSNQLDNDLSRRDDGELNLRRQNRNRLTSDDDSRELSDDNDISRSRTILRQFKANGDGMDKDDNTSSE